MEFEKKSILQTIFQAENWCGSHTKHVITQVCYDSTGFLKSLKTSRPQVMIA